ncbi:hypothetical protein FRC01_012190, partial [Tulasnella sp. 417]
MTWSEWRGSEATHDQAADIIQKILPENSRGFNAVLDAAPTPLDGNGRAYDADLLGEASGALRSALNPELVKLVNKKSDKLYEEGVNSLRALRLVEEDHEDYDYERPGGAILAWRLEEPVALTGILQSLKSFHLCFNTKLPSPAFSSRDEQTLFDPLSEMIKQNYLDLDRVPMPGGAPSGDARRQSRKAADEEEEGLYEAR